MTKEEVTICRIFLEDVAGKYKNCEEYKLLMNAVNAEPCEDIGRAEQAQHLNMREETPEEQKAVEKYLKKISKPTGENFWDSVDESCKDMGRYDPYTDSFVNDECIRRKAAIDAIISVDKYDLIASQIYYKQKRIEKLKNLPPVYPKEKTGHWIYDDECKEHGHCSECGHGSIDLVDGAPHNFCQKCGAKMESEVEDGENNHNYTADISKKA